MSYDIEPPEYCGCEELASKLEAERRQQQEDTDE